MRPIAPHSVWFLVFPGFQLLDVTGPLQVFAAANEVLHQSNREPYYQTRLVTKFAGPVRSSSGAEMLAEALPEHLLHDIHTALVPGGPGAWTPGADPRDMGAREIGLWLQREASRMARIASVCTGAFVLARARLLDGRKVVTHWVACDDLQTEFPSLSVERNAIYFRDGACWTSAGVTAGIDMALAMVDADLGTEVAMAVAKRLVVFYKRPGGQSQFSSALLAQTAADERIAALHAWIKENLRKQITVQLLAERLAMTSRTFARFYVERTGITPARAIEKLRLERACDLIESRRISIKAVSAQCGFSSVEVMRRSFMRSLHVGPADYQKRFSAAQS